MQIVQHPELKEGEVFLSNVEKETTHLLSAWKTARLGVKAYDRGGMLLKNRSLIPVFVSREEYIEYYGVEPKE